MSENDGFAAWCDTLHGAQPLFREAFTAGASWQARRYERLVRAAEAALGELEHYVPDAEFMGFVIQLDHALAEAKGEQ